MANFSFETITAAEALGVTAADHLTVSSGPAYAATVLYGAAGDITLILGAQSVDFGGGLAPLSQAGGVTFTDGTVLYVGDGGPNTKDFGFQSKTSGAFFGGGGDDFVLVGDGRFVIQLNAGNDQVQTSGNGFDTIYGGQGDDIISFGASPGTPGQSFAQGNMGNDAIFGGLGADTLLGGKGDDTISGNGGAADFLNGNLGNDNINGQGQLFGEDGNDSIASSGGGLSTLSGGNGDDRLVSGGSASQNSPTVIFGDDGNDTIFASNPGHDELHGGAGNDLLTTQSAGHDLLDGGAGDDHIVGADFGGQDDETLSGGDGADTIQGMGGLDVVFGGQGADLFFLGSGQSNLQAGRLERIMDWSHEDRIGAFNIGDLSQNYVETTAPDYASALSRAQSAPANGVVVVQVGSDVIVFTDVPASPNSIVVPDAVMLVGRTLADIDVSNFGF
jgi:Ca2+-binding RTX toxin-like protein